EGDVTAMGRKMREVRHRQRQGSDGGIEPRRLLVGQLEQILEKSQFMHYFKCRRVDRVPAEVAQKVGVLLQDENVNAGAGQQQPKHDSRRTAAGYAAAYRNLIRSHVCS